MKKANYFIMLALLISAIAMSQPKTDFISLFANKNLSSVNVKAAEDELFGQEVVKSYQHRCRYGSQICKNR